MRFNGTTYCKILMMRSASFTLCDKCTRDNKAITTLFPLCTDKHSFIDCAVNSENIRTAALTYGWNGVRFVQRAKVRIFFSTDPSNWLIRALLDDNKLDAKFVD